jgi:hypothetical protein
MTQAPPAVAAPTQPVTPAPVEKRQLLLRPAPVAAAPPPVKATAPLVQTTAPLAMPDATPSSSLSPLQVEMAREALHNSPETAPTMQPQMPAPAPVTAAPMASPAKVNPKAPIVAAPVSPAMMPPAANTAPAQMPSAADSQEARLAELLLLYKSDQITPTEYQARRAKILSGQ